MSIKKLALDVLYLITNEKNVEGICKEMLNYLLVSEPDFLQDLTLKVSLVKYMIPGVSPSPYSPSSKGASILKFIKTNSFRIYVDLLCR